MKKLLGLLLVSLFTLHLSLFGADKLYAFKMTNGKVAPFHVITAAQQAEYSANGFTIQTDKKTMYRLMQSTGQEKGFEMKDPVSSFEKFMWRVEFNKLWIGRALRAIEAGNGLYQEEVLLSFFSQNPTAKRDWDNATVINLDDPDVKQFLPQLGIDVEAVKLKMWEQGAR